jgi:capsule polysaccharide export protein KpsC/LpsZ
MKIKTQKILISLLLIMVIIDLVYIYMNTSSFNALYAGSSFILFGVAWDALNKLKGVQKETS